MLMHTAKNINLNCFAIRPLPAKAESGLVARLKTSMTINFKGYNLWIEPRFFQLYGTYCIAQCDTKVQTQHNNKEITLSPARSLPSGTPEWPDDGCTNNST